MRFVATFIMQLFLCPSISIALEMLNFAVYNTEKFTEEQSFFPFVLLWFKLAGSVLTQVFSIDAMMNFKSISSVLGGFVSHTIISNIDQIMAMTLTKIDIGDVMGDTPIMYKNNTKIFDDKLLFTKWLK
jgi:hypothetical protein